VTFSTILRVKCRCDHRYYLLVGRWKFLLLHRSVFLCQEKHAKKPSPSLDSKFFTDRRSHLYTLGMTICHCINSGWFIKTFSSDVICDHYVFSYICDVVEHVDIGVQFNTIIFNP